MEYAPGRRASAWSAATTAWSLFSARRVPAAWPLKISWNLDPHTTVRTNLEGTCKALGVQCKDLRQCATDLMSLFPKVELTVGALIAGDKQALEAFFAPSMHPTRLISKMPPDVPITASSQALWVHVHLNTTHLNTATENATSRMLTPCVSSGAHCVLHPDAAWSQDHLSNPAIGAIIIFGLRAKLTAESLAVQFCEGLLLYPYELDPCLLSIDAPSTRAGPHRLPENAYIEECSRTDTQSTPNGSGVCINDDKWADWCCLGSAPDCGHNPLSGRLITLHQYKSLLSELTAQAGARSRGILDLPMLRDHPHRRKCGAAITAAPHFLYLVQRGQDTTWLVEGDHQLSLPSWYQFMRSDHSHLLFVDWSPSPDDRTGRGEIFFPNSTLGQGRNLLYLAAMLQVRECNCMRLMPASCS